MEPRGQEAGAKKTGARSDLLKLTLDYRRPLRQRLPGWAVVLMFFTLVPSVFLAVVWALWHLILWMAFRNFHVAG